MRAIPLMMTVLLLAACGEKKQSGLGPGSPTPEPSVVTSQWQLHLATLNLRRIEDQLRAEKNPGEREILKVKLERAVQAFDQAEEDAEAMIESGDLELTARWLRWRGSLDQAAMLIDRAKDESARQAAQEAYDELASMRWREN